MITEQEYQQAVAQKNEAQQVIDQHLQEQRDAFENRLATNPIFTDEELRYSRFTLCPCGHGLAYPKDCGIGHYWDCSAILKGIADKNVTHTGQLPFAFYNIKAENEQSTTRGVFRPQKKGD